MALQDPNDPTMVPGWAQPPEWAEYINQFAVPDLNTQAIAPIGSIGPGDQSIAPIGSIGPEGAPVQQDGTREWIGPVLSGSPVPDEIAKPQTLPVDTAPPPVPMLGEVDAVSGAGAKPADGTPLGAAPMPTDVPLEQAAGRPEILGDVERGQLEADEAASDPFASVARRVQEETAHDDRVRAEQLDMDREGLRLSEGRLQVEMAARERSRQRRAQIDADAAKLAETGIDQDGWKDSRSPLQSIAAFAAIVGGGLVSGSTGGRNMGLEAIQGQIDQHIEIQKANLANKRAEIARRSQSSDDDFAADMADAQALATHEQAAYQFAIREMQARQAQSDPRGTQWRRQADGILEMQGRMAANAAKADQAQKDYDIKKGEYDLKVNEDKRKERESLEKAALARAKAGATKAVKPGDVVQDPSYFEKLYGKRPPVAMSQNGFEEWAKTGKVVEDLTAAQRANSPEERNRQLAVGELVDDNDQPLQFRSAESAEKVGVLKGSADFAVQILDRIETARELYGWSSDLMKSPEWREIKSDWSQYRLERKNVDALGVLAGPDLGLIDGTVATSDPTEARDPLPGIRRGRQNIVEKLNSTVRAQVVLPKGRKIKPWNPPKPPPPAPRTPDQQKVVDLIKFVPGSPDNVEDAADAIGAGDRPINRGLLPKHKKSIDDLVAVFNSSEATDEERKQAGAYLDELKEKSKSEVVRDYATSAAHAAATASIPMSKELP